MSYRITITGVDLEKIKAVYSSKREEYVSHVLPADQVYVGEDYESMVAILRKIIFGEVSNNDLRIEDWDKWTYIEIVDVIAHSFRKTFTDVEGYGYAEFAEDCIQAQKVATDSLQFFPFCKIIFHGGSL